MVILRGEHISEMVEHARSEAPLEACGILAGKEGVVERVYPAANMEESLVRYRVDPHEQLRIFMEIEERGWEILGIYHCHPNGVAYPSAVDVKLAFYPECVYIIISLAGDSPEVRAFHIIEGEVSEEEMVIASCQPPGSEARPENVKPGHISEIPPDLVEDGKRT